LEKQFGQLFRGTGRTDHLGKEGLRGGIKEDATFLDAGQGVENRFNLFAKKLDTVDLEAVFFATGEEEVSIRIGSSEIAGRVAVLFQESADGTPRRKVSIHQSRTPDLEFTDFTGPYWLAVFSDQSDAVRGHRSPDGPHLVRSGIDGQKTDLYDAQGGIQIRLETAAKFEG
jgi:hypothetical protein